MRNRGANEAEIFEVIRTTPWQPADQAKRLECRQNFEYNEVWNGKFYTTKQIRPIFVDEADEIVVVTVYVYFF